MDFVDFLLTAVVNVLVEDTKIKPVDEYQGFLISAGRPPVCFANL